MKPYYDNYCFAKEAYGNTTMYNSNKEFAHDASVIQTLVSQGFVTEELKRRLPCRENCRQRQRECTYRPHPAPQGLCRLSRCGDGGMLGNIKKQAYFLPKKVGVLPQPFHYLFTGRLNVPARRNSIKTTYIPCCQTVFNKSAGRRYAI